MTETQFIELIETYGAKPENWPAQHRAAMHDFQETAPEAAALLNREAQLDGWLDDWLDGQLPQGESDFMAGLEADMHSALSMQASADIITLPQTTTSRRGLASMITALAACFVGGFIAAPIAIELMSEGADVLAALDIISNSFLPTEPL